MLYYAGRILQLTGLAAMPSAMWIAHFERDEYASIAVFAGSFLLFAAGWALVAFARPR